MTKTRKLSPEAEAGWQRIREPARDTHRDDTRPHTVTTR